MQPYSFLKHRLGGVPTLELHLMASDGDARRFAIKLLSDPKYLLLEVLIDGELIDVVRRTDLATGVS